MGKISKIIWLIPIFVLAISIFGAKSALADCFDEPAMITAGGDISPDGGIPLDPRENCSNPGLESRETTFKLTPTADSDIILDSVELDTSVEGENYIRVSGTREATGVSEEYDLKIDYDNNTYTATKVAADVNVESSNTLTAGLTTNALTTTRYYLASVSAKVVDPVNAELNKTTLSLEWTDTLGRLAFYWRGLSTWAANPSKFGTHWYLQSANYANDPNTFQSANATFVNYHFLSGTPGTTYATTYLYINAKKSGWYSYYADLTTRGVAGKLLSIRVSTS